MRSKLDGILQSEGMKVEPECNRLDNLPVQPVDLRIRVPSESAHSSTKKDSAGSGLGATDVDPSSLRPLWPLTRLAVRPKPTQKGVARKPPLFHSLRRPVDDVDDHIAVHVAEPSLMCVDTRPVEVREGSACCGSKDLSEGRTLHPSTTTPNQSPSRPCPSNEMRQLGVSNRLLSSPFDEARQRPL